MSLVAITPAEAVSFVKRWHYTRTAQPGTIRFGWALNGELLGVSIYDTGTHAMRQGVYGPEHYRHVLHHHRLAVHPDAPLFTESQFIGACLRHLRAARPDVWAIVTYADACRGHVGTIYQATNAVYTGLVSKGDLKFLTLRGQMRTTQSLPGTWPERREDAARRRWREVRCEGKHRYVYLLGTRVQRRARPALLWQSWPYPSALVTDNRVVCERCGAGFTPQRSDARFCSARCRVAAHRARHTAPLQACPTAQNVAEIASVVQPLPA